MDLKGVNRFIESNGPMPSADAGAREEWLSGKDLATLLVNTIDGDVPVYMNFSSSETQYFLVSMLVPKDRLNGDYVDDILKWNFSCLYSWGYSRRPSDEKHEYSVEPPLSFTGSIILDKSEPMIFHRFFEGHKKASYLEVNQKITQILDVHHVEGRKSFCRFDENGDYEDVIILGDERNLCTVRKSDLDLLMLVTDSVLVRVYEFIRIIDVHNLGDYSKEELVKIVSVEHTEIYGTRGIWSMEKGVYTGSSIRGFQTITISEPLGTLRMRANGEHPEGKYESFIALDFKHKSIHECSCDPKEVDSYFTDTGKPFQTTPAFFNADVLTKYKQHPEKYEITSDLINCRGAWTLKRYDVNSEGQVNVFLCDLSLLPYKEQQYWKYFNEKPKAGISSRSITQDFEANFSDEHDALLSLNQNLLDFPLATQSGKKVQIWEFRGDQANRKTSQLHRVLTESPKEWESQILELTKIIVDGLNVASLRNLAQHLNCDNSDYGSITLLEKDLLAKAIDIATIESIVKPIKDLNGIRSSGIAHAGRGIPEGDLKAQFDDTLERIDGAMLLLRDLIEKGVFDI